jgi:hypothetical protein
MVEALPQASIDYMTAKIPMRRCGELDQAAQMICVDRFTRLHQRLHLRPHQWRARDLLTLKRPLRTARGRLI